MSDLYVTVEPDYVVSKETKAIVQRNVFRAGAQHAFVNTLRAFSTVSGQRPEEVARSMKVLSQASCPVVFAHGRQDSVLPLKHSELAHKQFPGSELYVFELCGHTPQIEKPDEVSTLLMCYLNRTGRQDEAAKTLAQEA